MSAPLPSELFPRQTRKAKKADPFQNEEEVQLTQAIYDKNDLGAFIEILNVFAKERSRMVRIGAMETESAAKDISRARKLLKSLKSTLIG